jgi:small conductance mechanosensitive channel
MNRRIKKSFDAKGIEIPFPHRTIYWGKPKQGAQPLSVVHLQSQQTS